MPSSERIGAGAAGATMFMDEPAAPLGPGGQHAGARAALVTRALIGRLFESVVAVGFTVDARRDRTPIASGAGRAVGSCPLSQMPAVL